MGSIINTFDKGLHRDSPPILQPDGTYTDMKNGMLISYDGNHYTVEMTKGNKVLLTLTQRYLGIVADLDVEPMPIGFISFIDNLVVFSTNNETSGGYGEIGVIKFTRIGMDFIGTYTPYYHHVDLNFSKKHKIEGFAFRENDNIQRVYWTDNNNEPRVFDIANPIFTDYKIAATGGQLEDGKQYMVLQGAIIYNSDEYGPGIAAPFGNVFTATTAGGSSFGISDGTPLVIEYYPISLLDWSPDRLLGEMTFDSYGTGQLNCGKKIYFYRLSSTTEGFVTSWSYASNPIQVAMSTNSQNAYSAGPNGYHNFVGNGSSTTLENSGKSVKIKVSEIDTIFDIIELCCAEFDQVDEIPYKISIIYKSLITGSEMTIEHIGNTNLGTVTISDITLFPASILKVKTLSTNKNYNIIANITEREEFDLDLTAVSLSSFKYPILAHQDLNQCVNNITYQPGDLVLGVNPAAVGGIDPWTRYLVTDITGGDITYNGNTYTLGEVFVGDVADQNVTIPAGSECRPCTTKNRYTTISGSKRVENAIEIKTGFWDYKDPAVAFHNLGYWSNERYRIGILFFDTKGNPFYVKWINDIDMPDISTKGGLLFEESISASDNRYILNPSGIKVSGLDIPESIMDKISGFSIVRSERDARIVTQGLAMPLCNPDIPNLLTAFNPAGTMTPSENLTSQCGSAHLAYMCPDHLSGTPLGSYWNVDGAYVEEGGWVKPYDYVGRTAGVAANTYLSSDLTKYVTETKVFDPQPHDTANVGASLRKQKTVLMSGDAIKFYNEDDFEADVDGTGFGFINRIGIGTANIDSATCAGSGIAPDATLDATATGCKKALIKLDAMFKTYSASQPYTGNANHPEKILLNYIRNVDKNSQYGGQSETAIANTLYMSCGHFQPINTTVKSDTLNGTFATGPYAGENKYTFNDIEIFGGDCYTSIIDLVYGTLNVGLFVGGAVSFSNVLFFPCESNSNFNLRRGRTGSRQGTTNSGVTVYTNGVAFNDGATIRLEDYSYNTGYSTEGDFIKYPALPALYRFTGKFEYRMRWAGLKYPGELVNSFRTFRVPDYRDLDGQNGQINNVKTRESRLFYWQDKSVGYTPILERQLVGGSALGDATALGVTGVIDRYDDIDTIFGNQHQFGLTETEYGFAWFDMRKRAFMVMGVGSRPEEMSMIKGLQVFFNSEFNEGNVYNPTGIYNTNDLSIEEAPLLGYGIVGVYDPTFKMTYLTFKYDKSDDSTGVISEVNRDFTLGYNHILNSFVSFTDCTPAIWHNHNDLVLATNNPKNTKAYNASMASTSYVLGDTVKVDTVEYICILPVTIASYPGVSIGTAAQKTNPTVAGSIYWLAINKTNEIYLQNFGSELCKFFGKVWNHSISIVVNAKSDVAVSAQSIQFKGIGANWTDVIATTDDQTASDLNISSTSRNYRYIDKSWFSSLPLPSNGRLTDYYVKINFSFKNYVSNPTVAKNVQRVLQWLRTTFVTKR